MKYAYDVEYLPLAQRVMGDMYDFAVNTLGYSLPEYHKMFLISGMAKQFEIANPTFVAGKNGCEIAKIVISKCCDFVPEEEDAMYLDKSPEYWCGWALAYFQWATAYDYRRINDAVPVDEICSMYNIFHETDISKFVEAMTAKCAKQDNQSRLKRLRAYARLSQRELAHESGVPLRQIQLFEQKQRDINKTQAITLARLAKALQCPYDALLESEK